MRRLAPRGDGGERASGQILVLTLFILLLLLALSALVASFLTQRATRFREEVQNVQLTAILDAGVAETMSRLWSAHDYTGEKRRPYGDGTLEIRVEGSQPNRRDVYVEARYWGGRRAVRVILWIDGKPNRDPPETRSWEILPAQVAREVFKERRER